MGEEGVVTGGCGSEATCPRDTSEDASLRPGALSDAQYLPAPVTYLCGSCGYSLLFLNSVLVGTSTDTMCPPWVSIKAATQGQAGVLPILGL